MKFHNALLISASLNLLSQGLFAAPADYELEYADKSVVQMCNDVGDNFVNQSKGTPIEKARMIKTINLLKEKAKIYNNLASQPDCAYVEYAFRGMNLDLSHADFEIDLRAVAKLGELAELNLSNSNRTHLYGLDNPNNKHSDFLQKLDISNNALTSIDELHRYRNVTTFLAANNKLDTFKQTPDTSFKNLSVLDLSGNSGIGDEDLPELFVFAKKSLSYLDLSRTGVVNLFTKRTTAATKLTALKFLILDQLDFAKEGQTQVDTSKFPGLVYFSAKQSNGFKMSSFNGVLSSLYLVDFTGSTVNSNDFTSFANLSGLGYLILDQVNGLPATIAGGEIKGLSVYNTAVNGDFERITTVDSRGENASANSIDISDRTLFDGDETFALYSDRLSELFDHDACEVRTAGPDSKCERNFYSCDQALEMTYRADGKLLSVSCPSNDIVGPEGVVILANEKVDFSSL